VLVLVSRKILVYVETGSSRDVEKYSDGSRVIVRATYGNKHRALKLYGVPDDDLDFTLSFLKECNELNVEKCIAIVRDERIAHLIDEYLVKKYPHLLSKVIVVKIPFLSRKEEIINTLEEAIQKLSNNIAMN